MHGISTRSVDNLLKAMGLEGISKRQVSRYSDCRRDVRGLGNGAFEAEPFWTEFLRKLTRRGQRGVKLGIKAAASLAAHHGPR